MSEQQARRVALDFHVGDRLSKALDYAGMSHQEMADYLGVTRNTVGNYIGLRSPVSKGTFRLWALRTGAPLDWLETGKAPRPDNGPEGGITADDDASLPDTEQYSAPLKRVA